LVSLELLVIRKLDPILMTAWIIATPPILIWWRESVPVLVFVSLYTVITGHWVGWRSKDKDD